MNLGFRTYSNKGHVLYYKELVQWIPNSVKLYIDKKLLRDFFEHKNINRELLKQTEIIQTHRIAANTEDYLNVNSNIFFYDNDLRNCRKTWVCACCLETGINSSRQTIIRIYVIGFLMTRDLFHCIESRTVYDPKNNRNFLIQRYQPKERFLLFTGLEFKCDWKSMQVNEVSVYELEIHQNDFQEVSHRQQQKTILFSTRNAPTLYLYILHEDVLKQADLYDMYSVQKECEERLELLWNLFYDTEKTEKFVIQQAKNEDSFGKHRRVIYTLQLAVCWDNKLFDWFLKAESLYIETICKNMLDTDDFVLTLTSNNLFQKIALYKEDFDRVCVTRFLVSEHTNSLKEFTNRWKTYQKNDYKTAPNLLIQFIVMVLNWAEHRQILSEKIY